MIKVSTAAVAPSLAHGLASRILPKMWVQTRAKPASIWLVIICLHAVVFTLPYATRPPSSESERSWTEMRLVEERREAETERASGLRSLPSFPSIQLPPIAPESITVIESPATAVPQQPLEGSTPSPAPQDSLAAGDRAPLNLALPRIGGERVRSSAMGDPRANTHISTFGERIANDLGGDGKWVEERMDADTVRLRRGNTCINLHRNRGAVRDPFNQRAPSSEWGKTSSYRCERR